MEMRRRISGYLRGCFQRGAWYKIWTHAQFAKAISGHRGRSEKHIARAFAEFRRLSPNFNVRLIRFGRSFKWVISPKNSPPHFSLPPSSLSGRRNPGRVGHGVLSPPSTDPSNPQTPESRSAMRERQAELRARGRLGHFSVAGRFISGKKIEALSRFLAVGPMKSEHYDNLHVFWRFKHAYNFARDQLTKGFHRDFIVKCYSLGIYKSHADAVDNCETESREPSYAIAYARKACVDALTLAERWATRP